MLIKIITAVLACQFFTFAALPISAPALPEAKGKTIKVKNVDGLYKAVSKLKSNTTLMLAKGTYNLTKPVQIPDGLENIAIRGSSGQFEDVILKGAGMNNKAVWHGIMLNGSTNILIADLTVGWLGIHPVTINPKAQNVHIYHCRLIDAGEQFIKSNAGKNGEGSNNGKVEYCLIEYSAEGPPNGYTNGVDVHGGDKWEIRHNIFRNIKTPKGAKYKHVPAVLMWNGAKDTICEGNTFINCDRAIAFGLTKRNDYPDHEGGLIQNNFIFVEKGKVSHADTGIFAASANVKIYHNTIILNDSYPNAIEVRYDFSKNAGVFNNLCDSNIQARDGAEIKQDGNILKVNIKSFRDASFGDLHIKGNSIHEPVKKRLINSDWDGPLKKESPLYPGADQP